MMQIWRALTKDYMKVFESHLLEQFSNIFHFDRMKMCKFAKFGSRIVYIL